MHLFIYYISIVYINYIFTISIYLFLMLYTYMCVCDIGAHVYIYISSDAHRIHSRYSRSIIIIYNIEDYI